jgi:hypothetical protein
MIYERFLDKSKKPSDNIILAALGPTKELWLEIHEYIQQNYDFVPESIYFTKNYGWSVRYRKGKKTLCYFFPESGAFSILIVLGKKEAEKVDLAKDYLNNAVKQVFENTAQFHDGRWMWIRVTDISDIISLKLLLAVKKKPKMSFPQ